VKENFLAIFRTVLAAGVLALFGWAWNMNSEVMEVRSIQRANIERLMRLEDGKTTPMGGETRASLDALRESVNEMTVAIRELRDGQAKMTGYIIELERGK
jgi:hypothetical protein